MTTLEDITKVLSQTVRDLKREVNKTILKVPEVEQKTLDATSNEPWGPHGTVMGELALSTRNFHECQMIMGVLWKRLQDSGKNWRHVYKSLTLMEYLVAHGSNTVIDELRENSYQIRMCTKFEYIEPNGKDQGLNVRKKAETLLNLLKDTDKIRETRQKAKVNKDKYGGFSSSGSKSFGNSGTYGGFGSDRYADEDRYGDKYDSKKDKYENNPYGGDSGRYGSKYDDDPYKTGSYKDDPYRGGDDPYAKSTKYSDDYNGSQTKDYSSEKYRGKDRYEDDDDFNVRRNNEEEPSRKSYSPAGNPQPAAPVQDADEEFDDFDPRGKPAPPVTATYAHTTKAVPPPAPSVDLFAARSTPAPPPTSAAQNPKPEPSFDLFGEGDNFQAAPAPQADFFDLGQTTVNPLPQAPQSAGFGSFQVASQPASAPAPPAPVMEADFGFSAFSSAPAPQIPAAVSPSLQPVQAPIVDPFAASIAAPAVPSLLDGNAPLTAPASTGQKKSTGFDLPKSGLWADALSLGLVDLNIGNSMD